MEKKNNITINDVARLAATSKRTVSRVINGSPLVGEKTRKRIEAVIKEHNFQPDKQARGLASKRSYLLGLIYDNPDALYIDQVQRGVLATCTSLGYELVVHPCHWREEDFIKDCLNFITRSKVDGVLILPPVSESKELASVLREKSHPYVRLASADLDDPDNIVISDERGAMAEIVEHLVSLNHKDIAVISGPMDFCSSQERLEGFINAASDVGVTIPESRIIEGKNTYESGIECGTRLLSSGDLPTAIFANNDEMAAGVIRVASDMGIAVPGELSIVGFDDNLYASRIIPSLTTMKRPVETMANLAAQKLIQNIQSEGDSKRVEHIVKPFLIPRESSASAASK